MHTKTTVQQFNWLDYIYFYFFADLAPTPPPSPPPASRQSNATEGTESTADFSSIKAALQDLGSDLFLEDLEDSGLLDEIIDEGWTGTIMAPTDDAYT